MLVEEWRPVVGFPDYAVSSKGSVRRVRADRHGRISGRNLVGIARPDGYLQVTLHESTVQTVRLVHRIVCEAFHGPCPGKGFHAAHGDGNRAGNHASNIRWATISDNNRDKIFHGTIRCGADHHANLRPECMPRGSSHGNAKLSDAAVQRIRADPRRQRQIAADHGVSQSLVSLVKLGRIWAHVEKGART
jgi:hypothetical protein